MKGQVGRRSAKRALRWPDETPNELRRWTTPRESRKQQRYADLILGPRRP
jgi:hypothetical protein